ncbi:MAG TPA: DUF488 domain-containing protein [Pirellulales bacterium]|nr:DUF488 domain-containing protein [Pirellulales bacterium]
MFQLKRAYEPASSADGCRVLVERLWPRGVSKARAAIDVWLKDVAPSSELRKWYGHDPARWDEFRRRYWAELRSNRQAVDDLRAKERKGNVTLVYAARDQEHSGALALVEFLKQGKPQPRVAAHREAQGRR